MTRLDNSSYEIPHLLDEVAQLAASGLQPSAFYAELLGRLTAMLGTIETRAWLLTDGSLRLAYNAAQDGRAASAPASKHLSLLQHALRRNEVRIAPPGANVDGEEFVNASTNLLILCPIWESESPQALLELQLPADTSVGDQEATHRLLTIVADLAASFHRNEELKKLRGEQAWWRQLNQFAQTVHAKLDPTATTYTIANDGRQIVGCDRLTVLLPRGRRFRAVAISGQDSVNRRANVVRRLESLSARALATGERLEYPNERGAPAPQVESLLEAYLEESPQTCALQLIPLEVAFPERDDADGLGTANRRNTARNALLGGLCIEQFSATPIDPTRVASLVRHAAVALRNTREHHQVFLLPVWAAVGSMRALVQARTLPKTLLVLAAVLTAAAALYFVPADFEMAAEGTLQPQRQRHVFAPLDGVIDQLNVRHGSQVKQDETLAVLRSSDVDLAIEEVDGQIQTTVKKLTALNAARTGAAGSDLSRAENNRLAAEEEELSVWLKSLRQQNKLYEARKESLTLKSPLQGEVITWDVENLLSARPVGQGQVLMAVADLTGPWQLELHLPDRRVGHLRDAQRELGDTLDVSYILATDPQTTLSGQVSEVSQTTLLDDDQQLGVLVIAPIGKLEDEQLRTGAKVFARIHCGRRSLGYVWFHDILEFIQSRILFPWL